MTKAFFISDIHGNTERYSKLINILKELQPELLFIGGDILPHSRLQDHDEFIYNYILPELQDLKVQLKSKYPKIFIILGNDDPRSSENAIIELESQGYWHYLHQKSYRFRDFSFFGYSYIPPTPFLLKDWERYDVSRFVDPGCIPPTEGIRTTEPDEDIEFATIADHLKEMVPDELPAHSVFLFHSPPYQTHLDRAALDGKSIDHVPLDVHVGSIAIRRFIEEKQPELTLHGHIHESTSITGSWKDQLGNTVMLNAAHQGRELSLIEFELENIREAKRHLI